MFYCVRTSSRFLGRGHIVGKGETERAAFSDAFVRFYDSWKAEDPQHPFNLGSAEFHVTNWEEAQSLANGCLRCDRVARNPNPIDDRAHDPSM